MVLFALGARQTLAAGASVEPAVPEGSISAARKSFDALDKKRTSEDRGAYLPKVVAPELTILSKGSPTVKPRQPTPVTKDWLVDGVMGKPSARADSPTAFETRGSVGGRNKEADDLLLPGATKPEADRPGAREINEAPGELDPTGSARPSPAMNPLASFMNSWISTQDRALLIPSAGAEPTAIRPPADSNSQSFGPSVPNKVFGEGGVFAANAIPSAPRENPFLSAGGPGALRPGAEVSPGLPARPPAPSAIRPFDAGWRELSPAAGPVAPSDKSPGPRDLGKRDDEAKYFRQLKRF